MRRTGFLGSGLMPAVATVGALVLATALTLSIGVAAAGPTAGSEVKRHAYDTNPRAHSSAKSVGSKVKLAGLTGNVTGGVKSKKRKCEKGRLASLLQVTFGGLVFIDTEKTTKKGKFGLEGAVPGRTYIVGVGKKTVTKFRFGKPPKKLLCTQTESGPFT
ncbi:MAG: hypothetical protein ACRDL3_11320, partial [Solirubrobacterales bacterium]